MDAPSAARFLQPFPFLLALAAATPTLAELESPFYPTIYRLISAHTKQASPLPPLTFSALQKSLHQILFTSRPDAPDVPSDLRTLSQLLVHILSSVLSSPDAVYGTLALIEPQCDAAMGSAYEANAAVPLFLRKVVVALYSLTFEALTTLHARLRQYATEPHAVPPTKPALHLAAKQLTQGRPLPPHVFATLTSAPTQHAPDYLSHLEATRRADASLSLHHQHRHFDRSYSHILRANPKLQHAHQYAALTHAHHHLNFAAPLHAQIALHDTMQAALTAADPVCQHRALSLLPEVEPRLPVRHALLSHANDVSAQTREQLLTVLPAPDARPQHPALPVSAARMVSISARLPFARCEARVNTLLISSAAWLSHADVPTALGVARLALRVARRSDMGRDVVHAATAVASLMALEGDVTSSFGLLRDMDNALDAFSQHDQDSSTVQPEREMVMRCRTWLRFERCVRRGETVCAKTLSVHVAASAEASVNNALMLSCQDLELDALEARCRWRLAIGDAHAAAEEADLMARRAAVLSRPARVMEGMRLRAEAHVKGGSPNSALSVAVAVVSLSEGLGLEAARIRGVLTLTEVILRMGGSGAGERALAALTEVMPIALWGLGVLVCARAYRLHAECMMAVAAEEGDVPNARVVDTVGLAIEGYERCEDVNGIRDCLYILARLHHWRGDVAERNKVAGKFNEHVRDMSRRQSPLAASEV